MFLKPEEWVIPEPEELIIPDLKEWIIPGGIDYSSPVTVTVLGGKLGVGLPVECECVSEWLLRFS